MNKKLTTTLLSAALVVFTGVAGTTQAADLQMQEMSAGSLQIPDTAAKTAGPPSNIYIVQMKGDPVMSYDGRIQGYSATKPAAGQKLSMENADVQKYAAYLESNQDQMMRSVGADKVHSYRYGINGFAARMSAAAAANLRARGDVVKVWKDEIRQLQTNTSPQYIGVSGRGKAWVKGYTGEDIVIGTIDTGIWPEHPSFADTKTPKKGDRGRKIAYGSTPAHFSPSGCDFGNMAANGLDESFTCNNKLLAARCYNGGFSSAADATNPCGGNGEFVLPTEFSSARDNDGHGTHTASTSSGNYGVAAAIAGQSLGTVSGIAPRARVSAYKVCWNGRNPPAPFGGGCASSDSAAAIDQAIADGVDVINFSIGGGSNFFGSADSIGFLIAANAGVFVATSNGNAGPAPETVGTPSGVPWLTAVGATQDNGVFNLGVDVNSPASIAGTKVGVEGNGDVSLDDTGPITDTVTLTSPADGCTPVAAVSGIALSIRGGCAFTDKYNNAAAAGASAIVVYNDGTTPGRFDPFSMFAPGTSIPGAMVGFDDGDAMANAAGVTATLDSSNAVPALKRIAGFSSRGANAGARDIIKPDLSAPGVQILAGQTPIPNEHDGSPPGELFQSISGTSMASPHVAGSFALLKQLHPDWTPAMARSALMTTARQGLNKTFGDTPADPFDIGAGEIQPTKALNPGLIYNAGLNDYLAFSCDNNVQLVSDGDCAALDAAGFPSDGSDLNLPSIGVAELTGSQTITRTVTSVAKGTKKRRFTVSVKMPKGVHVSVSPQSFRLAPGESATYTVTFTTQSDAVLNEWAFGSLTWNSGKRYSDRSPIAVRPQPFTAAAEVDGTDDGAGNGSVNIPIEFGYNGDYSAMMTGIVPGLFAAGNVSQAEGLDVLCVDTTAPNTHFRFATFDEDTTTPGADDIDLRLFLLDSDCADPDGVIIAQLGASGGPTSEEVIDVSDGPAGGYLLVIDYFSAAAADNIDYTAWAQVVFGDAGNTTVTAPSSAVLGASDTVTVDYAGVAATRNLGVLIHQDGSGEIGRTVVDVDAR